MPSLGGDTISTHLRLARLEMPHMSKRRPQGPTSSQSRQALLHRLPQSYASLTPLIHYPPSSSQSRQALIHWLPS